MNFKASNEIIDQSENDQKTQSLLIIVITDCVTFKEKDKCALKKEVVNIGWTEWF